jgi:hypothetical protein
VIVLYIGRERLGVQIAEDGFQNPVLDGLQIGFDGRRRHAGHTLAYGGDIPRCSIICGRIINRISPEIAAR